MAYEPAVVSFILVGMVGGVAVVMNASYGWEISHELSGLTERWTVPVIVRTYDTDTKARERLAREAEVLRDHGYEADAFPTGSKPGHAAATATRIVIAYHLS